MQNNSHPAIIDPEQWQKVQDEMAARKTKGRHHNSLSPFSAKLVCGNCGAFFGSKVWHSTDKYRRVIWQCNGKFKGERLWLNLIDRVTVYEDGSLVFRFKNGAEITEML